MPKILQTKTTLFIDELYPTVEKTLKVKSNTFLSGIKRYVDRNSEILYSKSPDKRLFFKDNDRDLVYNAIGLSPFAIKKVIDKCDMIKAGWHILNEPFNLAITLAIRYYAKTKNKKGIDLSVLYFSLSCYSSIQSFYFKYPPNPAVMEYTINNMSNKFLLKQTGNMFGAVYQTGTSCYNNFQDMIISGYDEWLKDFIMSIKDRQKNLIGNIFSEYIKNKESGKYLNMEQDDESEENYHEVENTSSIIVNLTNAAFLRINSKAIDNRLVKLSAGMAGCSQNATRTALINIIDNDNDEIRVVFQLILELFLSDSKNTSLDIGSQKFINFCWSLYIKSNTKDKSVIKIKDILDKWLEKNSAEYQKTERIATKGNFRKAIFLYMVFMLQQSYIHK